MYVNGQVICALHGRTKLRFVTKIEMSRKVCYLQLVRDRGEDNKLVIYAKDNNIIWSYSNLILQTSVTIEWQMPLEKQISDVAAPCQLSTRRLICM